MTASQSSPDPRATLCVVTVDLELPKLEALVREFQGLGLQEAKLLSEVGTIVGQGDAELLTRLRAHPLVAQAFRDARIRGIDPMPLRPDGGAAPGSGVAGTPDSAAKDP